MTEVQLELLTDIDMILMVEKGGRGICHVTNQYEMLVTNIWEIMINIKNR